MNRGFRSKKGGSSNKIRSFRQPKIFKGRDFKNKQELKIPGWLIILIVVMIILLFFVYLIFFSNIFRINDVIVEGNQYVASQSIIDSLPKRQNIFRFDLRKNRASLLEKFPEIKDMAIYRGIPNAIKIVVLERDSQLIWQSGGDYYQISSSGEIGRKIEGEPSADLPKVVDKKNVPVLVGQPLVSPHFVGFVTDVFKNIHEITNIKPTFFEIEETTFDVLLHTDAGFYVKLNTLRSSKSQLNNLKKILVEKRNDIHEYVDLRIDGWAYYK